MSIKHFIQICLISCISYFAAANPLATKSNHSIVVAESTGASSLSGNVMIAASKNPFQFATVTLINADTKEVTGIFVSLYNGYFKFTEVAHGNYQIVITAGGFNTITSPVITVFGSGEKIYAGKFFLDVQHDDVKESVKAQAFNKPN